MKRTLKTLLLGGLLAAVAIPVAGFAFDGTTGPAAVEQGELPPRMTQKLQKMAEKLDLTAQQQEQIKAIFAETHVVMVEAKQQIRTTMKALDEAITNGADNDTIAELAIDAHTQRADMRDLRKVSKQEVGAILTPEQKETLKELRAERRSRRGGQAGHKGGRGGGKGSGGFGGPL